MAAWVDLAALHNPAAGTRPPASWGDGINSNLAMLGGSAAAYVATSQSTSSTSFTDLATVGPSVTVDTGTKALVIISMQVSVSSSDAQCSVAVSGASTIAADLDKCILYAPANGHWVGIGYFSTLTAGSNIFTVKYSVSTGTTTFLRRRLVVIPLV